MEIIRQANLKDAFKLTKLGLKVFHETYSPEYTFQEIENFAGKRFKVYLQEKEILNINVDILLLESLGNLIGFIQLRYDSKQTYLLSRNLVEIERFYLLKKYHGKGLGKKLFSSAVKQSLSRRKSLMWLGVHENNWSAIKFYEKMGFLSLWDFDLARTDRNDDILMAKLL